MAGANKLKTGCYHYTSGKPEHSVKNNSIHVLNIKRKKPLKRLETKWINSHIERLILGQWNNLLQIET
jgi:hypothetical protein